MEQRIKLKRRHKPGAPNFFIIDPAKTLEENVKEMAATLKLPSEASYVARALNHTPYTDLKYFRLDDLVYIDPADDDDDKHLFSVVDQEGRASKGETLDELLKAWDKRTASEKIIVEPILLCKIDQPNYYLLDAKTNALLNHFTSRDEAITTGKQLTDVRVRLVYYRPPRKTLAVTSTQIPLNYHPSTNQLTILDSMRVPASWFENPQRFSSASVRCCFNQLSLQFAS